MDDNNTVSSTVPVPLSEFTGDQRAEWLNTGNTPTKEASAPSEDTPGAVDDTDKPAPDSETGKKQEPKKGRDSRIQELLDERHELRTRLEKLEKGDTKAAPPPAEKSLEKKPVKAEAPKRPLKLSEWTGTYDEHEEAMTKYYEDMADYRAKDALAVDRAEREKQSSDAEVEAQNAAITKSWKERMAGAEKDHADFKDVVFKNPIEINATTDGFILKDKLGAKVLYALSSDHAEAARIAALDPFDTMEALIELKRSLGSTEKAPEKKKTSTSAPKPPTELAGRNTDPADEAGAALNAGNFTKYQKLMNAREAKKD